MQNWRNPMPCASEHIRGVRLPEHIRMRQRAICVWETASEWTLYQFSLILSIWLLECILSSWSVYSVPHHAFNSKASNYKQQVFNGTFKEYPELLAPLKWMGRELPSCTRIDCSLLFFKLLTLCNTVDIVTSFHCHIRIIVTMRYRIKARCLCHSLLLIWLLVEGSFSSASASC